MKLKIITKKLKIVILRNMKVKAMKKTIYFFQQMPG